MSSVHKQEGKPNWFCAFYDGEGFRRFRSTGTDNRRVANTICAALERAAGLARSGKLSNEKALKLVRETGAAIAETHGRIVADRAEATLKASLEEFIKAAGGELVSYTVRSWLESWLAGRADASKATLARYKGMVEAFLKHLGARADRALTTLQPAQVEAFRDYLAGGKSPSTANLGVKVLKASLAAAVAKRQLEFSPAEHVARVAESESARRPFTIAEINALLKSASDEWRTMVLLAFYTGQRLRDCANLTWRNVDLLSGSITLATEKTRRKMALPIAEPLARHLGKLAGDNPEAPLCPTFASKSSSWLSAQFYQVMATAGLVPARDHQGKGRGRDAPRDKSQISFHSLRYSAVSELKNAGVSESVAMDLVGHETTAVSRHYTRIEDRAKREAVNKLPDVTG